VEGDIIASSDWDTCVDAVFYLSLVPGLASTGPRIRARVMMLSCEQSLLPGFVTVIDHCGSDSPVGVNQQATVCDLVWSVTEVLTAR
jgi:hypothetical protein